MRKKWGENKKGKYKKKMNKEDIEGGEGVRKTKREMRMI